MIEFLRAIAILVAGGVGLRASILAYRLIFGDSNSYQQNRLRTRSFHAAIFGCVPTDFDGRRDYRVAAGVAIDREKNVWVQQGRLSAEAVLSTLRQ